MTGAGGQTRILGILNATPDSFSDGGRFDRVDTAIAHGERLVAEGADVLDIGGESTRPGHERVDAAEQLRRILPVVGGLKDLGVPLSIDTTLAEVAAEALSAGAHWINDTSALQQDEKLAAVVADAGCPLILMHRFEPAVDFDDEHGSRKPREIAEVVAEQLGRSIRTAIDAGIHLEQLMLDPGLGFGKTPAGCLELMTHLGPLESNGLPLVFGPSRKRFIGHYTERPDAAERVHGTVAACVALALRGVGYVRVHDVAPVRDALRLVDALRAAEKERSTPAGRSGERQAT